MIKQTEEIEKRALSWFKDLLKIDTSNPPGDEKAAIDFIASALGESGIETQILSKEESRSNLFAAVDGKAEGPKLLLSSHVDVVPIEDETTWSFGPFSASEFEDCIWSRGALDMKFKTAFDMALITLAAEQKDFAGRIEIACLADEETGSDLGSQFLMDEHRSLFQSTHVLNEHGGFNLNIGGTEVLVIQAGEKHSAHLRVHCTGPSTHSCIPPQETAVNLLGDVIRAFTRDLLGFQLCPITTAFFDAVEACADPMVKQLVPMLREAQSVEAAIGMIPDPHVQTELRAMICHTLAPTRIGGGFSLHVIPETAWIDFDCRIVPALSVQEFTELVEKFVKITFPDQAHRIHLEFIESDEGYEIDMSDEIYQAVCSGVEQAWADKPSKPKSVPMLLPAASDCRIYSRAGMTPIGFAPLYFPADFPGFTLAHAANERMPIQSFKEGLAAYISTIASILKH